MGSGGQNAASHSLVARAIGSWTVAAAAATRSDRLGSGHRADGGTGEHQLAVLLDHVAGDRAAGRRAGAASPAAAVAQPVGGAPGVVQGVRDGTGVAGDPAQQRVAVVEVEQLGDRGAFLGDQPVDPAADREVQGVAGVEQPQVGGADGGAHGVGDAGPADAAQDGRRRAGRRRPP